MPTRKKTEDIVKELKGNPQPPELKALEELQADWSPREDSEEGEAGWVTAENLKKKIIEGLTAPPLSVLIPGVEWITPETVTASAILEDVSAQAAEAEMKRRLIAEVEAILSAPESAEKRIRNLVALVAKWRLE